MIMLTTKEAAEHAGVSMATIRYWIKKGYLGDAKNQSVTAGSGCGYKIRQSDLDRYIHFSDRLFPDYMKNAESIRMAANNLRIAIEFAQEELSKIEKLL